MDNRDKFYQDKESTIQYDVSELLQTDLSDNLKCRLMNLGNPEVDKFVALFPIQGEVRISVIRDSLNGIKDILPSSLYDETKDEVKEICDDYKWLNSKDGKLIMEMDKRGKTLCSH